MAPTARFYIGQIVYHRRLAYRGVVVDADPEYSGSDAWYDSVARSRPPRNEPWYRILVDGTEQETYVAERHLAPDPTGEPVRHPEVERSFRGYAEGRYQVDTH
ncbi:MAG: heat shock protein HspQ [Gammaproteobacteria bacterium]|nr:MAG: heat shock protein HspQ [Gammaproteobacteria bacterium]